MGEMMVHKPRCCDCQHYLVYTDSIPKAIKGVLMKSGCRYCMGGSKPKAFGRGDPKIYPASWCPITKSPAELRIYCFKDEETSWMRTMLAAQGIHESPSGYQYAVRYTGSTPLSAIEFYKQIKTKSASEVLELPVHQKEIIEIDDGHRPYYFYISSIFNVDVILFDASRAKQNRLDVGTDTDFTSNTQPDEGKSK